MGARRGGIPRHGGAGRGGPERAQGRRRRGGGAGCQKGGGAAAGEVEVQGLVGAHGGGRLEEAWTAGGGGAGAGAGRSSRQRSAGGGGGGLQEQPRAVGGRWGE